MAAAPSSESDVTGKRTSSSQRNAKRHKPEEYQYDYSKSSLTSLQHNTMLDIYEQVQKERSTGIICTIGPRSNSVEMLGSLMEKGMDVVRMNFSHGNHEYHHSVIQNARTAARNVGKAVAIALDTKGPEIRTGNFVDGQEVMLETNNIVRVSTNIEHKDCGTAECFYVDYTRLPQTIDVGGVIYIDDGLISLEVTECGEDYVDCVVCNSGPISNHKGVNLPNVDVDLPALSEKDKRDLAFGVEQGVDMVFASFIRKKEDVLEVREALGDPKIQIISKIENHEGVQKFDEILEVTDGVMVARGDLGTEIEPFKVFLAQKMMIAKCMLAGKPVIVATQMLESMIKNPRPTRAECTDVANAVLDGADCVMLSGETAKGVYPEEAVSMMACICREAEHGTHYMRVHEDLQKGVGFKNTAETVCCSAVRASYEQRARAIIVLSNSGLTARLVSKYRPGCPIIAVVGASNARTARQLTITRGVHSCCYDDSAGKLDSQKRVECGLQFGINTFQLAPGDAVVCVHADTMGIGFANLTRIVVVPEQLDTEYLNAKITTTPFSDFD